MATNFRKQENLIVVFHMREKHGYFRCSISFLEAQKPQKVCFNTMRKLVCLTSVFLRFSRKTNCIMRRTSVIFT